MEGVDQSRGSTHAIRGIGRGRTLSLAQGCPGDLVAILERAKMRTGCPARACKPSGRMTFVPVEIAGNWKGRDRCWDKGAVHRAPRMKRPMRGARIAEAQSQIEAMMSAPCIGQAACLGESSLRSSGSGVPAAWAASRKCAMREAGIPILRQLCTVERGASNSRATAVEPPR